MMQTKVLVVDDEAEMGNFFKFFLEPKGYQLVVASSGRQAREALQEQFHLILLDLKLPDTDGLTLLREIKNARLPGEVVIMTGYSTVKTAVEAVQLGAFDYLEKPFENLDELESVIEQALDRTRVRNGYAAGEIIEKQRRVFQALGYVLGSSAKMQQLLLIAQRLAQKNISLLIRGETGTGKEVLARYIHAVSARSNKPFLAINCGALPENILESELFGHEKGAFTGAADRHRGIFELAHKGVLFLDEIGDASPEIQVKLLRVLETGELLRVGGEKPVRIDARVIAATNAPLEDLVKQKRFREDLFYRLDVVTLTMPPLRERKEDIGPLAQHFLERNYQSSQVPQLGREAVQMLTAYPWPGNVRELANAMAQVAAMCDSDTVGLDHLPRKIIAQARKCVEKPGDGSEVGLGPVEQCLVDQLEQGLAGYAEQIDLHGGFDLPQFLAELKRVGNLATRRIIAQALQASGNRYPRAAELLHTTPRVLRYLNKEKGSGE